MKYQMINKATGMRVGVVSEQDKSSLEKNAAYSGIRFVALQTKADEKTEAKQEDQKADESKKATKKADKD